MVKEYKYKIGSRAQVMHGTAKMTGGGLTKKHLKYNKHGKIVSRKASKAAKKSKNLIKAGYITRKGEFGVIKKGGATLGLNSTNQKLIKEYIHKYIHDWKSIMQKSTRNRDAATILINTKNKIRIWHDNILDIALKQLFIYGKSGHSFLIPGWYTKEDISNFLDLVIENVNNFGVKSVFHTVLPGATALRLRNTYKYDMKTIDRNNIKLADKLTDLQRRMYIYFNKFSGSNIFNLLEYIMILSRKRTVSIENDMTRLLSKLPHKTEVMDIYKAFQLYKSNIPIGEMDGMDEIQYKDTMFHSIINNKDIIKILQHKLTTRLPTASSSKHAELFRIIRSFNIKDFNRNKGLMNEININKVNHRTSGRTPRDRTKFFNMITNAYTYTFFRDKLMENAVCKVYADERLFSKLNNKTKLFIPNRLKGDDNKDRIMLNLRARVPAYYGKVLYNLANIENIIKILKYYYSDKRERDVLFGDIDILPKKSIMNNMVDIVNKQYQNSDPVRFAISGPNIMIGENNDEEKMIYSTHIWGVNFETNKTANYERFITVDGLLDEEKYEETVREIILMAFESAASAAVLEDKDIYMKIPKVGLGCFLGGIVDDSIKQFAHNVFYNALIEFSLKFRIKKVHLIIAIKDITRNDKVALLKYGINTDNISLSYETPPSKTIIEQVTNNGVSIHFSNNLFDLHSEIIGDESSTANGKNSLILLVNAWDSNSFIGNGGSKDGSIDGWFVSGCGPGQNTSNTSFLMNPAFCSYKDYSEDKWIYFDHNTGAEVGAEVGAEAGVGYNPPASRMEHKQSRSNNRNNRNSNNRNNRNGNNRNNRNGNNRNNRNGNNRNNRNNNINNSNNNNNNVSIL